MSNFKIDGYAPVNWRETIRFVRPDPSYYMKHEDNFVLRIPSILLRPKLKLDGRTRHKRVRIEITIKEIT